MKLLNNTVNHGATGIKKLWLYCEAHKCHVYVHLQRFINTFVLFRFEVLQF